MSKGFDVLKGEELVSDPSGTVPEIPVAYLEFALACVVTYLERAANGQMVIPEGASNTLEQTVAALEGQKKHLLSALALPRKRAPRAIAANGRK